VEAGTASCLPLEGALLVDAETTGFEELAFLGSYRAQKEGIIKNKRKENHSTHHTQELRYCPGVA
jgi:hypothetical protein